MRRGERAEETEDAGSRGSLSTLGRRRRKSDSASVIAEPQCDTLSVTGSQGSPCKKDIGRVGGWAADFDKLLADTAGLQTFAEFLKKEFSHENIYFWCAAQRYLGVEQGQERLKLAKEIMAAHLGQGASDPVNVDSVARGGCQDRLGQACTDFPPGPDLFLAAQKQIYNLMKFDSFSRFLKSDLYKESLLADMACSPLPFDGSDLEPELLTCHLDLNQSGDSMKGKSGEGRRKSILPWNIKNRSKSKDRAESGGGGPSGFIKLLTGQREERGRSSSNLREEGRGREGEGRQSLPGGREDQANHSTDSCDKEQCTLTRFILPDRATTVVSGHIL